MKEEHFLKETSSSYSFFLWAGHFSESFKKLLNTLHQEKALNIRKKLHLILGKAHREDRYAAKNHMSSTIQQIYCKKERRKHICSVIHA